MAPVDPHRGEPRHTRGHMVVKQRLGHVQQPRLGHADLPDSLEQHCEVARAGLIRPDRLSSEHQIKRMPQPLIALRNEPSSTFESTMSR